MIKQLFNRMKFNLVDYAPLALIHPTCAGHGANLGGESPLWAESNRSISLGKGVHREVESEGSR